MSANALLIIGTALAIVALSPSECRRKAAAYPDITETPDLRLPEQ